MATKKPATKAKASGRTNSAKSPKASKATNAPGVTDIQMIPLNQLAISPKNVRKVKPTEAEDAELLASIREQGIKQNLVAYLGADGTHYVDAGGRRLKALQILAKEGAIKKDMAIPCLVEPESEATVTSTTENLQRAAMHPADQFNAFATMIDEGRSETDIARKFGVTEDLVRRRLKLARVAPEIFEAFREGDINLECIMAFTLTDHHDRQMTVWNSVKDSHSVYPHSIKRMLTETSYSAGSKLGKFVGIEAYEAAGGVVMSDLFSERDTTYFENPELVERLAVERLNEEATAYVGAWKWIDVHLELDGSALRSFGQVHAQELPEDHALLKEQEKLNTREAELATIGDERDLTDEESQEYEAIESRLYEMDDEIDAAKPFLEDDRAIAGVVLTIGWQGELEVTKGLVRPEDIPAPDPDAGSGDDDERVSSPTSSTPAPVADPAAVLRRADGITAGLADDLRTTRHHILRAHLSGDYDVAFDVMLYTMCQQILASNHYHSDQALDFSLRQYYANNREKLVVDSVADKMLEAMQATLRLEWLELDQPEDFRAMSALSVDDKQALFAFATAIGLKAQMATDNRPNPVIEELGARMDVDVAACWRPTAANYWGTVTKAHIASVAKDIIGGDFADERSSEKKGEAAAAMELAFAEQAVEAAGLDKATAAKTARWLPKGMEFEEANFVDELIDEEDGSADGDEDLRAFLNEDAA